MTERILKADVGDIVMVTDNSGKICKCKILDVQYMWNKDTPSMGDYIKFEIVKPADNTYIFFAIREKIWAVYDSKNEKKCSNCCYYGKHLYEYPCNHCDIENHSNWEPQIERVDYASFYPVTTGLSTRYNPVYDDLKRQISNRLASEQMWGIAQPIKLFSDIPDNSSVIKLDFNVDLKEDKPMNKKMTITAVTYKREIKDVIFSGPATIVKFNNQFDEEEKTVVKCSEEDAFDKTKGFLLALVKEFVDKKSWNNILRIIDSFEEPEAEMTTAKDVWDSLPQEVKDEVTEEIERSMQPKRKFNLFDKVTTAKTKAHEYEIDNYRYTEDNWEYRCNNGRGYVRWYDEDKLELVSPCDLSTDCNVEVKPWMMISKCPSILANSLSSFGLDKDISKKKLYDEFKTNNTSKWMLSESRHRYHVGRTLRLFEKMILCDIKVDPDELCKVLRHLIVCMDCVKQHLDVHKSEAYNNIRDIYNKYEHVDYVKCVKAYLDSIN